MRDLLVLLAIVSVLFLYLYLYENLSINEVIKNFKENLKDILIIFIFASFLSGLIEVFVDKKFILKFSGNKLRNYLLFAITGVATPGPFYSVFPIMIALKRKGVKNDLLISYITGQTIFGPLRTPLEIYFLGLKFFIYRLLFSIVIATFSGFLSKAFFKALK